MHNVFHISPLRKFVPDPNNVVKYEPLQVYEDLTYEELSLRIVDRKEQVLRRRIIPYVKIHWSNHEREATWELEDDIKMRYPYLFENEDMLNFEDEIFLRGVECDNPVQLGPKPAQRKKKENRGEDSQRESSSSSHRLPIGVGKSPL